MLWWMVVITAVIVAAIGLLLRYVVPLIWKQSSWHISWREFIAGLLAAYVIAMPPTFVVGNIWATQDALSYEQFVSGVETAATVEVRECVPGVAGNNEASGHSNCDYEYQTGETYEYTESYQVPVQKCSLDSEGDLQCRTVYETRYRQVTGYIYNPYSQREYAYSISDSLGGVYRFPGWYVKTGESFRDHVVPDDIPRGDPDIWVDAETRINEGNPRPVTRLAGYENYYLALREDRKLDDGDVERYLEAGLLPDHTANIATDPTYGFNDSFADKVSFVDVNVANAAAWQDSLMSFNAALNTKYQGDLHLVLVNASLIDDPVTYLNALKVYWLSDDFGRRAIGENAIIVVVGVQGDEVAWGAATTAMPYGNETMLTAIERLLPGTSLSPSEVLGAPRTVMTDGSPTVTISNDRGVLEGIILSETPFEAVCTECDSGKTAIEPEVWQWIIMISIVVALSSVYWYFAGRFELFNWVPGVRRDKDEWR